MITDFLSSFANLYEAWGLCMLPAIFSATCMIPYKPDKTKHQAMKSSKKVLLVG